MLEDSIKKLKNNDETGFDEIYKETQKLVFSICLSYMHDYQLAEDMMEDTYIKIYKNINSYNSSTNAKAWIETIAKNTCLNEIKNRKRFVYKDTEDFDNTYKDYDSIHTPLLDLAKKVLKSKELEILLLHIVDNKNLIDIAKEYNMPEGTVRWKYNNALKKIKKYMKEE